MKNRVPLEIISFIVSLIALLTCTDFSYPSHFGHYGIIDAIALILSISCLIKKLKNHERDKILLVYI